MSSRDLCSEPAHLTAEETRFAELSGVCAGNKTQVFCEMSTLSTTELRLSLPPAAASQAAAFLETKHWQVCWTPPDTCWLLPGGQLQHPGWGASPQNPYLPAAHPKSPPVTRFPPLVPDDRTQGCFIHSCCPSPQPVFLLCHERLRGNLWSQTPEVSSRSLLGCSNPSYPPVQFGSVESKDEILCGTFLCLKNNNNLLNQLLRILTC